MVPSEMGSQKSAIETGASGDPEVLMFQAIGAANRRAFEGQEMFFVELSPREFCQAMRDTRLEEMHVEAAALKAAVELPHRLDMLLGVLPDGDPHGGFLF